jgi:hypothetical protein
MAIQDRTHEFRSCVESIRNRSAVPPRTAEAKQRLLQSHSNGQAKSEFSRMASAIGKDISSTTIKLGKLAQRKCKLSSFTCRLLTSFQSRNGRHCLTTDQWRLVYACSPTCPQYANVDLSGTHIYHQTRHCKHKQANSRTAILC